MDRATRHRWALPEELDELPEASPDDVHEADELPEASPDDVQALDERPTRARSTLNDPSVRKTFPLRLSDMEREEGRRAAARMPLGSASLYAYSRKPWTEADWWRRVGLDWANAVNALPAGEEGELPSRVVKALRERIAQLEREMAEVRGAPSTEEPAPRRSTKRRGQP